MFAKDRPTQLEILIDSVKEYENGAFNNTYCIYQADIESARIGFETLWKENPWIQPLEQPRGHFKRIMMDILAKDTENVCFTTDDTILFDKVPQINTDGVATFSLRYGVNTILQDYFKDKYQPPLTNQIDEGETIRWDFHHYHPLNNYGFPFGLDMHCYKKDTIIPILEKINFDRPTELETNMFNYRNTVSRFIRSPKVSVAVNVPITNLTGCTESLEEDVDELNKMFNTGKRLRYVFNKKDIIASHQVLESEWIDVTN